MRKHLPTQLGPVFRLYLLAAALFMVFRLVLLATQWHRVEDASAGLVLQALVMGLRFDLVITGYIVALPVLLLTILSFTGGLRPWVITALRAYLFIAFSLAFLACAADIPYFGQFFQRLSITAFEWMDNPLFVARMIAEEPRYWLAIVPFIGVLILFHKRLGRILRAPLALNRTPYPGKVLGSLLILGLVFLGIRGRIDEKSPIRVGTAYFSDHAFLNQLGLNPCFTLIRSWLDSMDEDNKLVALMDDAEAIARVQADLGIVAPNDAHPLARAVSFDAPARRLNVVLVIMESMSAARMERHGCTRALTPFLDSLSRTGLYFENAYTSGIHTFNGVFSTLFSFPALFRQHPMKESGMLRYHGIFNALREHGYATAYFTTHDGQFDNAEGFMRANGCERVITKADYPADDVKTTLGVPDDRMFAFALPILDEMAAGGKPFVAAFMTASDHGPFYIPPYFTPTANETRDRSTQFADWSLRQLVKESAKHSWYDSTLFVFVADHGAAIDGTYDMSLDYHHTPLLFHAPRILAETRTDRAIAGQIDVFPTIMGVLRAPYENRTLGIDLLRERRPFIYFNADDKYGVLDDNWFLIEREDGSRGLHRYREKSTADSAAARSDVVERMSSYARAHMQAMQYVVRTGKQ
ncbi:MAG: sulfatase-like hydrolase/transferase [Flavobacteriales bacterium]|nr:sulfatase-like hydrolase/transferase [Flavobacteriales bacterium]